MTFELISIHWRALLAVYSLSTAGQTAAQLYPLATAIAINGVIEGRYWDIVWLLACHLLALTLEVFAKFFDTRIFTKIYSHMAGKLAIKAHTRKVDPSIIAAHCALSREHINFLERDIPAVISASVSISISLGALIWLDFIMGIACLLLIAPLIAINYWLIQKSSIYNHGLNNRLEQEITLLRAGNPTRITRHFKALSGWYIKLSDAEAKAYGLMELTVMALIGIALWRLVDSGNERAGDIYAVFAYVWRYVSALDNVPQVLQQLTKLKDINSRLRNVTH